jgi:hypothetical protein
MLAVGDIVRQTGTSEMLGFTDKLAVPHAGGFSDLQVRDSAPLAPGLCIMNMTGDLGVCLFGSAAHRPPTSLLPQRHAKNHDQTARLGDSVVALAASSTGRVSVLAMQLPAHPGATAADLQMPEGEGSGCLTALPWQHKGPVSSVDINSVTRVGGRDG